MIIALINLIVGWTTFLLFADKKKFPLFVSTSYTAIILVMVTNVMLPAYPLWEYPGTSTEKFWIHMMNGFGLYPVVLYLFLQLLPQKQTVLLMIIYIFCWTVPSILLEVFYLHIGFFKHHLWWNIGLSYAADWVLFTFFYVHHKWISSYLTLTE